MTEPVSRTPSMQKVFEAFRAQPTTWWSTAALFRETQLHNATLRAALARLVKHGLVTERGSGPRREFHLTAEGLLVANVTSGGDDAPAVTLAQLRAEVAAGLTDRSVLDAALRKAAGNPPDDGY